MISCFLKENIWFKESSPNIMIIRNPNWSTEILWFGIGYTKEKMLSAFKHPICLRQAALLDLIKITKNLFFFFCFLIIF
jgi:hypothetical protein